MHGRAAEGDERARLWARWKDVGDDVDAYATRRSGQTAVVVLEPRTNVASPALARAAWCAASQDTSRSSSPASARESGVGRNGLLNVKPVKPAAR